MGESLVSKELLAKTEAREYFHNYAEKQRGVVKAVGDRLLTPFGLRTLDELEAAFPGRLHEATSRHHVANGEPARR